MGDVLYQRLGMNCSECEGFVFCDLQERGGRWSASCSSGPIFINAVAERVEEMIIGNVPDERYIVAG